MNSVSLVPIETVAECFMSTEIRTLLVHHMVADQIFPGSLNRLSLFGVRFGDKPMLAGYVGLLQTAKGKGSVAVYFEPWARKCNTGLRSPIVEASRALLQKAKDLGFSVLVAFIDSEEKHRLAQHFGFSETKETTHYGADIYVLRLTPRTRAVSARADRAMVHRVLPYLSAYGEPLFAKPHWRTAAW